MVPPAARLSFEADTAGEIRLWVQVNEEHSLFGHGEGRPEVDGVVVLPTPPF